MSLFIPRGGGGGSVEKMWRSSHRVVLHERLSVDDEPKAAGAPILGVLYHHRLHNGGKPREVGP